MTERLPGNFNSSIHCGPFFPVGPIKPPKYSYSHSGLTSNQYMIEPNPKYRTVKPTQKTSSVKEFKNVDEIKRMSEPDFILFKEL
jgi:hypothetical protein